MQRFSLSQGAGLMKVQGSGLAMETVWLQKHCLRHKNSIVKLSHAADLSSKVGRTNSLGVKLAQLHIADFRSD